MSTKSEIKALNKRLDRFAEACREAGFRVTHQRTEVLREVAGTDTHPSAESVYDRVKHRVPAISRDTVYRTLAFLEEIGMVRRVDSLPGPVRYDGNTEDHHHFVCRACGAIKDFESDALNDFTPPPSVRRWGAVESVQIHLRGVCASCRKGGVENG